jgi:hypothetical protein
VNPGSVTGRSWGLDNVRVSSNSDAPLAASAAAPSVGLAAQALGSIYGLGLEVAPTAASGQPWPLTLGGVSVTMGGRTAPFLYVSPVQINFEIPAGTSAGDVPLSVQTGLGGTLNFFLEGLRPLRLVCSPPTAMAGVS